MFEFKIFNIPVRVEPWFWITLAFVSGQLTLNSKEGLIRLLLFILAGFISILVHELGHALSARHFGHRVHIVLQAFGGYAAYQGGSHARKNTFLITAAGPAIQIALGLVALAFAKQFDGFGPQISYFVGVLYVISFFWAIFNLLPILPMDGGRMLETILGPRNIKATLIVSIATATILCLLSLTFSKSFIIPIFMGYLAYQSFKALQQNSWR
ncbi:MAG: site-2 protease family protein [Akkermansiaceae bacterium]|jgi:stage IV sporulation protein FB|nr:site-2 protease family protein [Akkermansiaceae bacterium]MDP4646294.1 site-2 protease family protein [Akkermansiaceae bacterium]MDP4721472.1 site-2 protease family protein [Akkermansiaceae bacterium]MDP4779865.1 site-2 protease family protein [Akkermansiaceae bacterium]MDP4845832.1 site-2 protease family protein [Akkermansiaceae bacterium]